MTGVTHLIGAAVAVVLAVGGFIGAWRWVIRPMRNAWVELVGLLRQIRDASRGVERLSRELHELAGAVVQMTVRVLDVQAAQQKVLDETRDRLSATTELVIDLAADFRRLERAHRQKGHES